MTNAFKDSSRLHFLTLLKYTGPYKGANFVRNLTISMPFFTVRFIGIYALYTRS